MRVASGFIADRWQPAQGGRRGRLRPVRGLQVAALLRRQRRGAIGRDRARRPHRQGHPHGAARRDDLAQLAAPSSLATAFGVHRALDTAGAMLGPLVAFGLLADRAARVRLDLRRQLLLRGASAWRARPLRGEPGRTAAERERARRRLAAGGGRAAARAGASARSSSRPARSGSPPSATASSTSGCSAALDFEPSFFPLLFVGTAAVYMLLAVPVGPARRPRSGAGGSSLGGYGLLLLVYARCCCPRSAAGGSCSTSASSAPTTPPPTAS